jgi:hypothetical protein
MLQSTSHSDTFAVPLTCAPFLLLDARTRRQVDAVCRIGTAAGWHSAGQAVGDLLAELRPIEDRPSPDWLMAA